MSAAGSYRNKVYFIIGTESRRVPETGDFAETEVSESTGRIDAASAVWNESKIRTSSPPTPGQATVFDLLTNRTVSKNQLEFEVLSDKLSLIQLGLPKGSIMGLDRINQISIDDGLITVISIF